jgi:hypothetical protein
LNRFDSCVDWLGRAFAHLRLATHPASFPHLVVDAGKILADPATAGAELARFVGLASLQPGSLSKRMEHGAGGLPNRFADGHWQAYAEPLGESFAKLPSCSEST